MTKLSIIVIDGPSKGTKVALETEVTIGRSANNDLRINDGSISRNHAVVKYDGVKATIYDLDAVNGVIVDGARVKIHLLKPNQVFRLGRAKLQLTCDVNGDGKSVVFDDDSSDSVITAKLLQGMSATFLIDEVDSSEDELRKTKNKLSALYKANQIISEVRDISQLLPKVMGQIISLVPADNGVIMLKDDETGELEIKHIAHSNNFSDLVVSSTIVQLAYTDMKAVLTSNAAGDTRFEDTESIIGHNITSAMCVPLIYMDDVLGVIYLDSRGLINAFDNDDLELLAAFASTASIAIKNAAYVSQLERSYRDTLHVLANAVELRDHYTAGHIWRVTNFAVEIARNLGWPESKLKELEMGGVMHDIGKISIDNAILSKKGKLTASEYEKIKVHPERGAWLLRGASFMEPLIPYCLYHHEHYDGSGYPYGLVGENIPIEGRVVAVADAFDALTSHRPYNNSVDVDDAVCCIKNASGTHFDPEVVDAFIKAYKDKKIDHILQNYMKNEKSIVCPFCSTSIKIPENGENLFKCVVCHHQIKLSGEGLDIWGELFD